MEPRSPWQTYLVLLFGTFVTIEAAAFQAPAIPSVARHYGIPINLSALILLFYFLALTVFAPIMGRLADRVGRKRILTWGLFLFSMAEFLAASGPGFPVFLAARFLQGFGVACILPGVMAYVNDLFPAQKRGAALGILTLAMTLGAASGGLLGGLLIDSFGWPSVYWISGALAIVGLVPLAALVPEIRSSKLHGPFDLTGAVWLFITIGALLSLPTWAGNFGIRSSYTFTVLGVGILGLVMLTRIGYRAAAPVVDLSILKQRAFALPTAIYWLHLLSFSGVLYSLAFFINGRPGGSASQFGFVSLFLYGSCMISAPIAGRLVDRINPRRVSIFALTGTLIALVLFTTIRVDTPLWFIVLTVSALGLMMGGNTPAIMKLALGAVPQEKMGAGTGLFSMLRDLGSPTGSSFALAVFGTSLAIHTERALTEQARALGVGDELLGTLGTLLASKGQAVTPALARQLQAHGMDAKELLRLAGLDGLSAALPSVGYLLIGMVGIAWFLSFLLPRSSAASIGSQEGSNPGNAACRGNSDDRKEKPGL
ncbi:MAG: MFS transporter [Betaproteobacteria bacterium]|nr:MFS transporter [Betaproteobacteria bacterium]